MAFSSATHDIAADGFYMLRSTRRAKLYVGIRSTFYRIATIAGSGLLIMLAGTLETFTRRIAYSWSIAFYVLAAFFIAVTATTFPLAAPRLRPDTKSRVGPQPVERHLAHRHIVFPETAACGRSPFHAFLPPAGSVAHPDFQPVPD